MGGDQVRALLGRSDEPQPFLQAVGRGRQPLHGGGKTRQAPMARAFVVARREQHVHQLAVVAQLLHLLFEQRHDPLLLAAAAVGLHQPVHQFLTPLTVAGRRPPFDRKPCFQEGDRLAPVVGSERGTVEQLFAAVQQAELVLGQPVEQPAEPLRPGQGRVFERLEDNGQAGSDGRTGLALVLRLLHLLGALTPQPVTQVEEHLTMAGVEQLPELVAQVGVIRTLTAPRPAAGRDWLLGEPVDLRAQGADQRLDPAALQLLGLDHGLGHPGRGGGQADEQGQQFLPALVREQPAQLRLIRPGIRVRTVRRTVRRFGRTVEQGAGEVVLAGEQGEFHAVVDGLRRRQHHRHRMLAGAPLVRAGAQPLVLAVLVEMDQGGVFPRAAHPGDQFVVLGPPQPLHPVDVALAALVHPGAGPLVQVLIGQLAQQGADGFHGVPLCDVRCVPAAASFCAPVYPIARAFARTQSSGPPSVARRKNRRNAPPMLYWPLGRPPSPGPYPPSATPHQHTATPCPD